MTAFCAVDAKRKAAGAVLLAVAVSGWAAAVAAAAEDAKISPARSDANGFLVHTVTSPYQAGEVKIKVLLPDRLEAEKRYPVLYVLPVEPGDGEHWGNAPLEVKRCDLCNKYSLICVYPTFSDLPWYADHPTNPQLRQESYLVRVVVPWVDRTYPTSPKPAGRLLVGFSKSGWGAFSLLLRHPDVFGKAAAWDAPLMMDQPNKYGMGPIFGTQENFEKYQVSSLLRLAADKLGPGVRLIQFGYGNFRDHHQSAERLMDELKIPHWYRDGPKREHSWGSGWLAEAVKMLVDERTRHNLDP